MKKILLGVCSIGQGHFNRQKLIIAYFLKKGMKIIIVTSGNEIFFKSKFPMVEIVKCSVPWIITNNNGIDFENSLLCHKKNKIDFFEEFLRMSIQIEKKFGGVPDLVISDYEPNVAKYAYSRNIPLVNLEQQSKFLLYDNNIVKNNIAIKEETSRLNYFFPKSDLKIISSFFPIEFKLTENIYRIPPIINLENKYKVSDNNYVTVYFSTYGGENSRRIFEKILKMISTIDNYEFKIYSELKFDNYKKDNIIFYNFSDQFIQHLRNSLFVISTAGHQLISECILYEKPMLLTAFNTFEQNFNLSMVNKYKLGSTINNFEKSDIVNFVEKKENYSNNIREFKQKYWKKSWDYYFNHIISNIIEN